MQSIFLSIIKCSGTVLYHLNTFQKSMLLTPKYLRAGDFEISVFRSPGKGVPIMMELQADSGVQEEQRACIGIEGPGDQYQ